MDHLELILLFLLVAVAALTAFARVVRVPYPIMLVIGGSVLGFAPGVPNVVLDPDVVLLIFLPPLLFNAAYFTSVHELRADARVITLQAVLLLMITVCLVAVTLHAVEPEIPWAAAFAFGAIVSPTDPLAAVAVLERLGVPRRMITVVEGESLVNDGTGLVVYRTAVAAATGGGFDLLSASGDIVVNIAGGAAIGLVAAQLLTWAFRRVEDQVLGVVITLLAGYLAYIPAEEIGCSGVIAAVTVGLVVGYRAHVLFSAGTRLQSHAFWEVLVFLLNAVLFVLVGLQLPGILDHQDRSALTLIGLGLLMWAAVTGTRFLWGNTMPYVIRALDRRPSQRARRVGWRTRTVGHWSGLRGAVSLAAALALPPDFPERDLLVFLTLCVIFGTLVVQGLTLPLLVRALGVHEDGDAGQHVLRARKAAARAAITRLEELKDEDWTRDETIERMTGLYNFRYRRLAQRAGHWEDGEEDLDDRSFAYQRLVRDVLDAQRAELVRMRDGGEIPDRVLHEVERELDLEDQRLEI
jgi:Na+/H+ antiporter